MLPILIKTALTLGMYLGGRGTEISNMLIILISGDAVSIYSISVAVEILELKWTAIHRDYQ